MRGVLAGLVVGLLVVGCTANTAFEARCLSFSAARSSVHKRLSELSTDNLIRLSQINQAGRVICSEDIDDLTAELDKIMETLP